MFVGACWHHIYGGKWHDDSYMIFFRQYAESFHLRINTVGYFLPARHPSHIMGNRVPLGCDLNFQFLVGVHNNTLLALDEIHRSHAIYFAQG